MLGARNTKWKATIQVTSPGPGSLVYVIFYSFFLCVCGGDMGVGVGWGGLTVSNTDVVVGSAPLE